MTLIRKSWKRFQETERPSLTKPIKNRFECR